METDCTDLVVFSYSSPFADPLQADKRIFTICEKDVYMNQKWQSGGRGGTDIGYGASVYNSSIVLAYYIETIRTEIAGKVTVELGCGPGLVSVAAMLCGCQLAVCTDGDDLSISLAGSNLTENCSGGTNFLTEKLLWGNKLHISSVRNHISLSRAAAAACPSDARNKADFILASDVAALPYEEHYEALVNTLEALSDKETTILLTYQRRHSSESRFFDLFKEKFNFKRLPRSVIHVDFKDLPIVLYQAHLIVPE